MTLILASAGVDSLVVKSQCGKIQPRFRPPLTHTHTLMCADVMLVSQLLAGMFSLAAIYGDLTEVTAQEVLLMLTVAAAGDREPSRGGRFSL